MIELTKKQVLDYIEETREKSQVLKGAKTPKREWTINELIYCLQLVDMRKDINTVIAMDNMYISCCNGIIPLWVDIKTRSKKVKIIDVVIDEYEADVGDDSEYVPETCYSYIIKVKEVK